MTNFSGLALSRTEMKNVLGGSDINCSTTYYFNDGSTMSLAPGGCSGKSISQCTGYGVTAANAIMAIDPSINRASVNCYY